MTKIFSDVEPQKLLFVIIDTNNTNDPRTDVSDEKEWLQISVMNLPPGKKVNPHIHQPRASLPPGGVGITQECWIVLRGEIKARLFDLDQKPLRETTLGSGQMLVTFFGGHALETVGGALMVECKNGPYLGRDYISF